MRAWSLSHQSAERAVWLGQCCHRSDHSHTWHSHIKILRIWLCAKRWMISELTPEILIRHLWVFCCTTYSDTLSRSLGWLSQMDYVLLCFSWTSDYISSTFCHGNEWTHLNLILSCVCLFCIISRHKYLHFILLHFIFIPLQRKTDFYSNWFLHIESLNT